MRHASSRRRPQGKHPFLLTGTGRDDGRLGHSCREVLAIPADHALGERDCNICYSLVLVRRSSPPAQKVRLGELLEPDIAARAEKRMKASLKKGAASPAVDICPQREPRTRDETARTVGIGSGRTYERGKEVLDQLRNEPDLIGIGSPQRPRTDAPAVYRF